MMPYFLDIFHDQVNLISIYTLQTTFSDSLQFMLEGPKYNTIYSPGRIDIKGTDIEKYVINYNYIFW